MNRSSAVASDALPPWQLMIMTGAAGLAVALIAWLWWLPGAPAHGSEAVGNPGWTVAVLAFAVLVLVGAAAMALRHAGIEQSMASELREARERLRCIDELLDVWQWQTDAQHRLVQWRPPRGAAPADWADAPTDAATATALWQVFRPASEAALRAQLDNAAALDDIEVDRTSADGTPRPGRLRARARTDAQGLFAGYQGTWQRLDSAPPIAPPAPARTVAAGATQPPAPARAAAAVAATSAAASAAASEQESFSFTVSHDLRAPIRVVEGFTKIVKEDYGRLLDRVGNDHLDRVLGAAARMNNMIDALLALSKLSSQPLARQPVNLSQLAGYVADDLRRQWPDRQVGITIEPGMQVQGDPTLLRLVIENLLGNAWKYSAKAVQPQIWFERSAAVPDTFCVRDNGAGFDMRFADRLFGVFQRLHSANDFPGTGVGLASVRRIVRRHGGDNWGEAEVRRGARIEFTLPQGNALSPSA